MSERSVEPRVNSGLPTMGEPASFRVVGVAHEEGSTSLRMEYHFEGEACHCGNHADEPDACHQTIVLAYFVKPTMVFPGDEVEVIVRHKTELSS